MRFALILVCSSLAFSEELPLVTKVEFQPLAAQVTRVLQALELLGEPLPAATATEVRKILEAGPGGPAEIARLQTLLDVYCLVGVNINP